jgi:hypothetical protein
MMRADLSEGGGDGQAGVGADVAAARPGARRSGLFRLTAVGGVFMLRRELGSVLRAATPDTL